ncbi:chaplin [Streptomyces sp. WMMC500]|uniref:chaplin n=1 Tax=Streptomyces sp. WMMC500 TaxID=3015154 RepID=UPI00248CA8BF|nr:chaplin [Streptomyces sp. WMMC500]WBB60153.1 chaplin [Streptomyces sp. WMMC500]
MRNLKRAAALTIAASGLAVAGAGVAVAQSGAGAQGTAVGSPGLGSGNLGQMPVHMPGNACGNTGSFIGALNPAFGNLCINR